MSDPTQPLRLIGEIYNRFSVMRELEHIHDTINGRIDARLTTKRIVENTLLTKDDSGKVLLVNTAAARTIRLPAPEDKVYFFIKDHTGLAGTNNISVVPNDSNSGQRIDGATSQTISTNYASLYLVSDGLDWFLI